MAEIAGKAGSITFTGLTVGVKSWTLDYTADALEITDFADSGNRTYIVGLKGWTAAAEGNWDAANTAVPGVDPASLVLTATTGKTYTGNAILISLALSEPVDGVVTASYSFQGSGALTIA